MPNIFDAASVFRELTNYYYEYLLGYRCKESSFRLCFHPSDFSHLAGLNKLRDLQLPRTPRRIFEEILEGRITQSTLESSSNRGILIAIVFKNGYIFSNSEHTVFRIELVTLSPAHAY